MRTPLPPVIEESLSVIDSQCINLLHLRDQKLLGGYITAKAKKSLLEQKKSLIVISDEIEPESILQALSTERLAHFACKWDSQNNLSNKLIERFRILTTLSEVPRSRYAYQHILNYTNSYHKELMINVGSINKLTASGISIKEDLSTQNLRLQIPLTSEQHNFFDQLETNQIFHDQLRELESKYHRRFKNLTLDKFDDSIYLNKTKFISAKKTVDSLVNHFELIKKELASLKTSLLADLNKTIDKELEVSNEILNELREIYFTYDFEKENNLREIIKRLLQSASTFTLVTLNFDPNTTNSISDLDQVIRDINKTIETQHDLRIKLEKKYFKRFTPFNIDRHNWQTLNTHITELRQELDNAQFLPIDITHTPLTLTALESDINKGEDKLIQIQSILLDQEFTAYKLLQNQLNLPEVIINLIDSLDNLNWSRAVDAISQEVMLKRHLKIGIGKSYSSYHKLNELIDKTENIAGDTIHNSWIKNRKEALDSFQTNHKETCQLLLSAVIKEISLANLFFLDSNFVTTYFPITIIRASELSEADAGSSVWDSIIYYDIDQVDIPQIQKYIDNKKEISIATTKDFDPKPLQSMHEMQIFSSDEEKMIYGQPFSLLQNSERLQQARFLSIALNGVAQSFSVYQLKNKSIISFANTALTQKLLDLLPSDEVNVLYNNSKAVDDLIDAMIPIDREIFIIHENGLINDKKLQTITWQMHLLKLLEECGVTLIDINTIELAKNYRSSISDVIKKINSAYVADKNNELVLTEMH